MSDAGHEARDEAMARVDQHAADEWKRTVDRCVRWLAHQRETFTTDDVWDALERYYPEVVTHDNRAMGPRMLAAVRLGLVVPRTCPACGVRATTGSKRPVHHVAYIAVYDSRVYGMG